MTYYLIAILAVINVTGISLKLDTNRRKQAMDGVSKVCTFEQIDEHVIGEL